MPRAFVTAALLMLAACAAPEPPQVDGPAERVPWRFETAAAELRAASCPDGVRFALPETLEMTATPVELGEALEPARHLPGARFAGGWELTSPDPGFGGLSGLGVFRSGNLLAVSDEGAFVWITLEDGAPARASIAPMRGADGAVISGKRRTDAEGLALRDGLALVSFERDHRILAFDLEGCGANARGAAVAETGARLPGMDPPMRENGGMEGLGLTEAGLLIAAIETGDDSLPLAQIDEAGGVQVMDRFDARGSLALTGLDLIDRRGFAVLRDFTRGYGNDIEVITFGPNELPRTLVRLDPSLTVDNFEAIAADRLEDGTLRLWLLSDDNFSARQRTLLFAFDVTGD